MGEFYRKERVSIKNNFTKGKYKIGQIIKTNEKLIHNLYEIIEIIDKKYYNMYVAKNLKYGWKYDFTDMDELQIISPSLK